MTVYIHVLWVQIPPEAALFLWKKVVPGVVVLCCRNCCCLLVHVLYIALCTSTYSVYIMMIMCFVGDSSKLHDHDGGTAGPVAGHRCGKREARAGGGEESTHSAVCTEQEVRMSQFQSCPLYTVHTKLKYIERKREKGHPQ